MQNWKEKYKADIKTKLKESDEQYNKYKKTNSIIHLQQAGNKLFSAVENLLMVKYGKRTFSYNSTLKVVENNADDKYMLIQACQLHRFYYNGRLQMGKKEANEIYQRIKIKIKERIKRKIRVMTLEEARPYMKEAMEDNKDFYRKLAKM